MDKQTYYSESAQYQPHVFTFKLSVSAIFHPGRLRDADPRFSTSPPSWPVPDTKTRDDGPQNLLVEVGIHHLIVYLLLSFLPPSMLSLSCTGDRECLTLMATFPGVPTFDFLFKFSTFSALKKLLVTLHIRSEHNLKHRTFAA